MGTVSAEPPPGSALFCTECGRRFAAEDLARFGTSAVCVECKPRFVQRMREGVAAPSAVAYGGFWRRFLAVVIDGIITSIIYFPIEMAVSAAGLSGSRTLRAGTPGLAISFLGITWLISLAIGATYETFFISQKGATPGKMVMGLKVVTTGGGPVSVPRALARYFAKILSGIIFFIGYIMAAFDSEKRALHDHICDTRVIRQS